MKIMLISGSHRANSQSEKVARYMAQSLLDNQQAAETEVFTLAGNPLPLWDEGIWNGDAQWQAIEVPQAATYAWQADSTYIQHPPFFDTIADAPPPNLGLISRWRI